MSSWRRSRERSSKPRKDDFHPLSFYMGVATGTVGWLLGLIPVVLAHS